MWITFLLLLLLLLLLLKDCLLPLRDDATSDRLVGIALLRITTDFFLRGRILESSASVRRHMLLQIDKAELTTLL